MSSKLAELCTLLIEDTYGEFFAHIFSVLLSHGRQPASQLAQKCHLPLRQTRHGLAVLSQVGIICHYTTSDGRTSYEANPQKAYYLTRSGRVIETVQRRYGETAASIVTQVLLLGHASVGQLKIMVTRHASVSRDRPGADDNLSDHSQKPDHHAAPKTKDLDAALRILSEHGIICRLRDAHFRTDADNRQMAEDKVQSLSLTSTAKGTKLKDEIAAGVEVEIQEELKSRIQVPNPSPLISDSLIVRLNYSKFATIFRNKRLIALASKIYGESVSHTYEAVITRLEPTQLDARDTPSLGPEDERPCEVSDEVDEYQLAQELSHVDMAGSRPIPRFPSTNGHGSGVTHQSALEKRSHLEILCQSPHRFLRHSLENPNKYVIEYAELSVQLRNAEIFRIISARFDKYAVRIIQALLDKGKMDEKYLQEIVLMSAKELRQMLSMLQQAGFVELQEVPRDAQRQPSRTMYLWFYDPDRVRRMLLEDTYKCMARLMHRSKVEAGKIKSTIEKSERSDVRGNEKKFMPQAELEVLEGWRRKEEWLLGEIGRLDDLIFVLRDF